jgi:hypothetical protein
MISSPKQEKFAEKLLHGVDKLLITNSAEIRDYCRSNQKKDRIDSVDEMKTLLFQIATGIFKSIENF